MAIKKVDPAHQIQCSYRILIGPWDEKTPLPLRPCLGKPGNSSNKTYSSKAVSPPLPAHDTSTIKNSTSDNTDRQAETSINTTARPRGTTNSNYLSEDTFHTANSSLLERQSSTDEDTDAFFTQFETDSSSIASSNSSADTIRPITLTKKHSKAIAGPLNNSLKSQSVAKQQPTDNTVESNQQPHYQSTHRNNTKKRYGGSIPKITYNSDSTSDSSSGSNHQDERSSNKKQQPRMATQDGSHQTLTSSLLWRESGPIFIPSLPDRTTASRDNSNDDNIGNQEDTAIKHDFLLCMLMSNDGDGKRPTAYKERHTNSLQRLKDWRQMEVVLTCSALKCYDSKELIWPHRKLQHCIPLDIHDNPGLSLSMLSSLDYTFCLQYTPKGAKENVSMVFRARSLTLCQEWLEWIFWESSVDGSTRSDKVICPQLIEKTHQLELRRIQHTPHSVILGENTTLREPYPCEGFLTKITDFEGRQIKAGSWVHRRFYFSSFGGFLFAVPAHKTRPPHKSTYLDPTTLKHGSNTKFLPSYLNQVKSSPYVTLVTPYAGNKEYIDQPWQKEELDRRMHLIAAASGHINLAEVSYVRRSFGGYSSSDGLLNPHDVDIKSQVYGDLSHGSVSSSLATSSTSPMLENGTKSPSTFSAPPHRLGNLGLRLSSHKNLQANQHPCIELVMKNGTSLKLQAYSNDTCDQWVSCLSDLVIYAKARVEVDRDVHSGTRLASPLDSKLKVQNKKVKTGVMYVQSKNTFSQKQVFLTMDGMLHYYNIYKRSNDTGKPINTGIHEKKGTLDMANAYVYSGLVTSMDRKTSKHQPDRPPRLFRTTASEGKQYQKQSIQLDNFGNSICMNHGRLYTPPSLLDLF
ncbi:hypothetical protein BC941DRAFT_488717 [Chlamydoabsidia padenii]|nr:hypothetical protein BC941DRAFT_488717 [Chlamydoabsidia padenii]